MKMTKDIRWEIGGDGRPQRITLRRPSTFHGHFRDGPLQRAIARAQMQGWKYALAMPNTGPITTIAEVRAYHDNLCRLRDEFGFATDFIMTLYFTDRLTPEVVEEMVKLPFPSAVKWYPPHKGATTGSGDGIPFTDPRAIDTLGAMSELGVRLLGHFESVEDRNGNELPHEQREDYFMAEEFPKLREENPGLHITIEHATTAAAIARVKEDLSGKTVCGITPQAMLLTRPDLNSLTWGVHAKCMPIAKTAKDRDAVREFALSGDFRAHAGDDTAAHPAGKKLLPFGQAASGCYLPHSLALYTGIFEKADALTNLPKFASYNGPAVWELPPPGNDEWVTLIRDSVTDIPPPTPINGGEDVVIAFGYSKEGDALHPGWRLLT